MKMHNGFFFLFIIIVLHKHFPVSVIVGLCVLNKSPRLHIHVASNLSNSPKLQFLLFLIILCGTAFYMHFSIFIIIYLWIKAQRNCSPSKEMCILYFDGYILLNCLLKCCDFNNLYSAEVLYEKAFFLLQTCQ